MEHTLLATEFEPHRRRLWGLAYRMTGSAADADELVQETFVRVLEKPPPNRSRPLGHWLTKVATNLSRDRLRARKRRPYVGPWLPTPVVDVPVDEIEPSVATRYDVRESLSLAFLHALEVLTSKQRAVLILRDVLGYSSLEVGEALDLNEGAVKTQLHRARAALLSYDAVDRPSIAERDATIQRAIARFVTALTAGDGDELAALLRDDVAAFNDGGGRYHAALKPIRGPHKVTKFTLAIAALRGAPRSVLVASVNGLPALLIEFADGHPLHAPRAVMALDVDRDGRVVGEFTVLCDEKLTHVFS